MASARRYSPAAALSRRTRQGVDIKRWTGDSIAPNSWDGLHKDIDLWYPQGDCIVHLYAQGQSQRGPSFQIPSEAIADAQCTYLLGLCRQQQSLVQHTSPNDGDGSFYEQFQPPPIRRLELHLAAPQDSSPDEAYRWHLTTRNLFAWICGKPLVGKHLGQALTDLLDRMKISRPHHVDNVADLLLYTDWIGYHNFANNPDYALAMLYFAERQQLREVWIDAFAHSVGMNGKLSSSSEFEPVSHVTKALITRSYLEMYLHLERASKSLRTFLDDEFSATHVGLGGGARDHLENFRSFIQSFYVAKFGYWPPPGRDLYPKTLYLNMLSDFQCLYEYLADKNCSLESPIASGGICVLQNIQAFNERQRYCPLPYSLPLIPSLASKNSEGPPQRGLQRLRLGGKDNKVTKEEKAKAALLSSTNHDDASLMRCPLVRAYMRFEDDHAFSRHEKVTLEDARKVRWILLYGILQTLVSITSSPSEVRNSATPNYPLCCLTTGTPPWKISKTPRPESRLSLARHWPTFGDTEATVEPGEPDPPTPEFSVQPDCEIVDYFKYLPKHNEPRKSLEVADPTVTRIPSTRAPRRHSIKLNMPVVRGRSNSKQLPGPVLAALSGRPATSNGASLGMPHTNIQLQTESQTLQMVPSATLEQAVPQPAFLQAQTKKALPKLELKLDFGSTFEFSDHFRDTGSTFSQPKPQQSSSLRSTTSRSISTMTSGTATPTTPDGSQPSFVSTPPTVHTPDGSGSGSSLLWGCDLKTERNSSDDDDDDDDTTRMSFKSAEEPITPRASSTYGTSMYKEVQHEGVAQSAEDIIYASFGGMAPASHLARPLDDGLDTFPNRNFSNAVFGV